MVNYTDVDDVKVRKWGDEEEPIEEYDASVEELYYCTHSGNLELTIHIGGGEIFAIDIPVLAKKDWNAFAESLPIWD